VRDASLPWRHHLNGRRPTGWTPPTTVDDTGRRAGLRIRHPDAHRGGRDQWFQERTRGSPPMSAI